MVNLTADSININYREDDHHFVTMKLLNNYHDHQQNADFSIWFSSESNKDETQSCFDDKSDSDQLDIQNRIGKS